MRRPSNLFLLLALCFPLAFSLIACEEDGPTAPESELSASFSGTFAPSSVAANGVCSLEIEATATGGEPPYGCRWEMSWINQAASARGYPNDCVLNISLPDRFGPGLFGFDLEVTDSRDAMDRAGTDEQLDCGATSQTTFSGF